jgi:hypothetical protein
LGRNFKINKKKEKNMFNDKILKSVAEAVKQVLATEKLHPNQQKLDVHEPEKDKLTSKDFEMLRKGKKAEVKEGWDDMLKAVKDRSGPQPSGGAGKKEGHRYGGSKQKPEKDVEEEKPKKKMKEEVELDEAQSHQAKTTMKHVANPTAGEKKAAKDIKPGVAGYRDRIAMLKSAEARGGLKEGASQEDYLKEVEKAKKKANGEGNPDLTKGAVTAVKQESVEQIDELKKSTLASYVKKASHDVAAKGAATRQFANDSEAARKGEDYSEARKKMKMADKTFAKSWKRREGMAKAVDKLAKEEVEHIDETHQVVAKTKQGETFKSAIYPTKEKALAQHYKMSKSGNFKNVETVKVKEEVEHIEERSMTEPEMKKREKIVKSMKKGMQGFKDRYGDRAKDVMYATATKQAMKD